MQTHNYLQTYTYKTQMQAVISKQRTNTLYKHTLAYKLETFYYCALITVIWVPYPESIRLKCFYTGLHVLFFAVPEGGINMTASVQDSVGLYHNCDRLILHIKFKQLFGYITQLSYIAPAQ